eukprot:253018-Karenia_brevis.AAC.1
MVKVINDFEAIGYGIQLFDKDKDILILQDGKNHEDTFCAVIGADEAAVIVKYATANRGPSVLRTI